MIVPQVRVRGRRSGKREPFWAGPINDAITADIRPLQDELLEMKEAGELPEEADAPSQRELFASMVGPLLDRIPPTEADMIELYFLVGKSEADLGRIFEMSQAAISYRLEKAMKRIKWLTAVPSISETDVTSTLPSYGLSAWEVEFMAGMWRTTSVSEMSRRMVVSQAQGRRDFYRLAQRLRDMAALDDAVKPFADYFDAVRESPGILWEGAGPKKPNRAPAPRNQREVKRAQILELVRDKVPAKQIARRVGVTAQTVYKVARQNGTEPPEMRAGRGLSTPRLSRLR